jgi:hypothetical protein
MSNRQKTYRRLHGYVGFFILGIVCFYATTGILLNHRSTLKIGYKQLIEYYLVNTFDMDTMNRKAVQHLLLEMDNSATINSYEVLAEELILKTNKGTFNVHGITGSVQKSNWQHNKTWSLIRSAHTATVAGEWSWIADLYAVGLIAVSISGLYIGFRRKIFWTEQVWILFIGFLFPMVFVLISKI